MVVVQHLHIRVKESIGELCLWVCPYFSNSVPRVLSVLFGWLEIGGRWLYSCCFVGCYFQNLFNIGCNILVQFPSNFFSICLVSVYVVHPFSRIDTTATWKKLHFILLDKFDFHMIDNLLIAVHAFISFIVISFSVDEMLLPR